MAMSILRLNLSILGVGYFERLRFLERLQDLAETFGHHLFEKIWQITFAAICDGLTRRKSSKIVNQDTHQSFRCLRN